MLRETLKVAVVVLVVCGGDVVCHNGAGGAGGHEPTDRAAVGMGRISAGRAVFGVQQLTDARC